LRKTDLFTFEEHKIRSGQKKKDKIEIVLVLLKRLWQREEDLVDLLQLAEEEDAANHRPLHPMFVEIFSKTLKKNKILQEVFLW